MNSILNNFDVREARLDNGLRVLVREDHSAPVVAIFTHVLAGYFDEPDEWVGISHVLEHMFFKGTPTRGPGVIGRETKNAGGYLNASTIYDHTSYYTVLPAAALAQGLELQSDALLNPVVDEEQLRKELLVIIQEAKRKRDDPSALAVESLYELMFDAHRMRRWRIGQEDQLRGFTRADVMGFFERYYTADSIILVVAGDVTAESVFEIAQSKYAGLRRGAPERDRGVPPSSEAREFRFRELRGDIMESQVEVGWHTPATLHKDTPYLDLLAAIVGQGRASHLYRNVREAGKAVSVGTYNYTPTELGVFGITAGASPEDTEDCVHSIFETVAALRAGSLTSNDLARAQSALEARALRRLETMEGQAGYIAQWQAVGDWRFGTDYLDSIMSARLSDISRVAEQYLAPESAAVLCYQPHDAAPLHLTLDSLKQHA